MSRKIHKRRAIAVLSTIALGAATLPLASMASNAGYTDRERVFDNQISTNTLLDLIVTQPAGAQLNGGALPAGYEISWDGVTAGQDTDTNKAGAVRISAPNIAPGDKITIPLTPENVGDVPLAYTLDVCSIVDSTNLTSLDGVDAGDASDFAGVGSDLTENTGVIATILDADNNAISSTKVGGPGTCSFRKGRSLGVGDTEDLTLELAFPITMTNASTGAVVDVDLKFNSEQTMISGFNFAPIVGEYKDHFAMGMGHTCNIRNGGEVWCWGQGKNGALGYGGSADSHLAVRAGNLTDVVKLRAGIVATSATTSTGEVWSWGHNIYGQLGLGHFNNQFTPSRVNVPNIKEVLLSNTQYHSAILLDSNEVRVAGWKGLIGNNNTTSNVYVPVSKSFNNIKDVAVGKHNVYVLDGDGSLWGTGAVTDNALLSSTTDQDWVLNTDWERLEEADIHNDKESLFVGRFYGSAYRRANGEIWAWGQDRDELGLNKDPAAPEMSGLVRLPHYENAKQIVFGANHAVMLKHDGTVWTNGNRDNGRLGHTKDHRVPNMVDGLPYVRAVSAGYVSTTTITQNGRYAWGMNAQRGLGTASTAWSEITPMMVIR